MTSEMRRWFAGVDWGSEKHQVCLLDAAGKLVGERGFRHSGAGLAALCDWLVSAAGEPGAVAVAIEVPHGPVVDALLDRGFAVHAINPKQLERLRDRASLAGAKDDRRDARIAAGGLRTDPHLFRPVEAGDAAVIALREWSRLAEELQQERVRLGNRIRQQLWRYRANARRGQPAISLVMKLSSQAAHLRLPFRLTLSERFARARSSAIRRSTAMFRAAFRSRTRLASSPKVTSSTQLSPFSIAQCWRIAAARTSGDTFALET